MSDLMKRHGVTLFGGVPTFFANWLAERSPPCLRTSCPGCALRPRQERHFLLISDGRFMTVSVWILLTVSAPRKCSLCSVAGAGKVRYGCTGRAIPGYELRIIDEQGASPDLGKSGELQVKGPTVAAGFWKNRPKTM